MAKFRVGEICIGQYFQLDTERNGMECEVVAIDPAGGTYRSVSRKDETVEIKGTAYMVCWSDGLLGWTAESKLRRKPPSANDRNQKISWDDLEKITGPIFSTEIETA